MTANDRAYLERANAMMMIGDIPREYINNNLFSPSFCPHPLQNINVVVGGNAPVVDPIDESDMKYAFILLGTPSDETLFTINNSHLFVHRDDCLMLLRNARPYPPQTLLDVFKLNPKYYSISALNAGANLVLKEGDILLAKRSTSSYYSVSSRRFGPEKLAFNYDCQVYVCVPGFATKSNAMNALGKTGVLRDIRLRIEMFVDMYSVVWDVSAKKVVYTIDAALKSQYRNQAFAQLKDEAFKIRAPTYTSTDPLTDEDEDVVDEPSEGVDATDKPVDKKGVDATDEPVAKKAKVGENE
jgi:hypothetical protein